ncbi:MAG: hypothetical protein NVS1B3_13630 [Candidatus Dormibacteraceae bacterium]
MVRGDDVRRGGNVLEAGDCDAEQNLDEPPDGAANEAIEGRWTQRFRMDQKIQLAADELSVLRACVTVPAPCPRFAS